MPEKGAMPPDPGGAGKTPSGGIAMGERTRRDAPQESDGVVRMHIPIADDFDLAKIARSGQCFRVKEFEGGLFRFVTGREVLYIRQRSAGDFEVSCPAETWQRVWVPYFDLGRSYSPVQEIIPDSDTYMKLAAKEGRGIRILRQDPWEMLVTFIISQRKSIPAIRQAVELLAERFGAPVTTPYETLYTFPTAAELAGAEVGDLAACKLGYRVPYIRDAVARVLSGQIDLAALADLPDPELFMTLKTIRGVGDKVANCICLFSYGRMSAAPIDTWIHKIIAREYGGKNPFPAYGAYAGILQQFAFYYAIAHKERFSGAGGGPT